ncbi:MAG: hypothetical protein ACOZBH_03450 [Patescibacteria group bacterium]
MLDRLSVGSKIIILSLIGIIIIAAIVLGFLYYRQRQQPTGPAVIDETTSPPRQTIIPTEPSKPSVVLPAMTDEEKNSEELTNLAKIFAERFGSFSNQGGFDNLDIVQSMATDSMKSWLVSQKKSLEQKYPISDAYYGVTTQSPIAKVLSYGENNASVLVTTQRQERKNGDENNYTQDIKIEFVKINGNWLINAAYWQ